jgi:hypothetical protein
VPEKRQLGFKSDDSKQNEGEQQLSQRRVHDVVKCPDQWHAATTIDAVRGDGYR